MPTLPPEIKNITPFNLILAVSLIIVTIIPTIIIGIVGSLIAAILKKPPKSKGITSKEISKRLEEKRKNIKNQS
jgi:hypothetical protein